MLSRGAIRVVTVRGVPVRLHWSVLIFVPFLVLGLGGNAGVAAEAAGLPGDELLLPGWAWGLVACAGLLGSIVVHELAHTLVAQRRGGHVRGIVLMALGGVSELTRMPPRAQDELRMAVAGPLVSLGIAALATLTFALTRSLPPLAFGAFLVGYLNLLLGLFNLVPAFPMDGGRALRAALTLPFGARRATRISVAIAKLLAVAFGLLGALGGSVFLVLIAVFVWLGATQERARSELVHSLKGLRVGDVIHAAPLVRADTNLEEARLALLLAHATSGIVMEGARTIGVIRRQDLLGLPLEKRLRGSVRERMLPVVDAPLARGDELGGSLDRVLQEGEVPVVDESGTAVGVVRSESVIRELQDRQQPGYP